MDFRESAAVVAEPAEKMIYTWQLRDHKMKPLNGSHSSCDCSSTLSLFPAVALSYFYALGQGTPGIAQTFAFAS